MLAKYNVIIPYINRQIGICTCTWMAYIENSIKHVVQFKELRIINNNLHFNVTFALINQHLHTLEMLHSLLHKRLKPRSDIRCNRFATSPRLTIYTNRKGRNKVLDRSRRGCREVGDWSGTSLRPNQSQLAFCACRKTWLRLIWSQTGPGKVADQSPISRRLVADRSPNNFVRFGAWLLLKVVGDLSAIGRRLIGDLSATSLQLVGDLSATCSKM